ncbi:MAG: SAM-dependent chlorinase/fluorinase [Bryobacteraceae bacterium]|jgi:S-adenosylmethionine hydrolase
MRKPIVTLTTDFGLRDHYVGAMRGVILGICPQAQIVDISHEVKPFQISEGAFLLAQACSCFPSKTVHVAVVDPGVGSARRPILVEAATQYFVAPDNGVLAMIYAAQPHKARVISNQRYFRQPVSRTFHGRDIFAPVAAHLAAGLPAPRLGKRIDDYLRPGFLKPQRTGKRTWAGEILHIDRFGNLVTNFHASDFPDLETRNVSLSIGPQQVTMVARNYAECASGELFLIVGSTGYVEVSLNRASAARAIGCETGAPAELMVW